MRLNAPKFIMFAFSWLVLQLSPALSAPVCSAKAVIGSVATAPSWVRARETARARWVSAVNDGVGHTFSHWRYARHRGYMCWSKGRTKYCKATATPCNGRAGLAASKRKKKRAASQDTQTPRSQDRSAPAPWQKEEPEPKKANKPEQRKYGYFNQQLEDKTVKGVRCAGRSIRISGKVLRTIKKAKQSAQSLWSEYIAITKGKEWSGWDKARSRRVQCEPDGYKVKCEVSALACQATDQDRRLQQVDKAKKRDNRLALPVKRPEVLLDETEEQDPGEYGDGSIDEDDGKIELPEKRDGFSLPWLIEPPAGRPEPEDGEGGPFGKNEHIDGFEVSKLEKGKAGKPPYKQRERLTKKQGSLTPAFPVKRPHFDNLQAMLEEQNNYYQNEEASNNVAPIRNAKKQETREKAGSRPSVKKSPDGSGLTLPFKRPSRVANEEGRRKAERRFSQNFDTDPDEEQPDKEEAASPEKTKRSGRFPVREDSDVDAFSQSGRGERGHDTRSDRVSRDQSVKKSKRVTRKGKGKGKGKRNASRRTDEKTEGADPSKNTTFQGWKAEDEANPTITRQRGKRAGAIVSTRKFKRNKAALLKEALANVHYTNSAAIVKNFKAVYGCKEEEVASWGKAEPTKPQAQQSAIRSWQKLIYTKYGKNWSDWIRAGSSRVQCGRHNDLKKCVAIASPCGIIQPARKQPFAQALRCRIYALSYVGERHKSLAQARQNALNKWEKNIEKKFGVKWANWFQSLDHVITCKKKRYKKRQCRAKATPCSVPRQL